MRFESSVTIQASPERVWEVFSDVGRWPTWTPTVDSVERLDDGRIHLGSRTRIRQPKLPVAVWEVTELIEGEYFAWVAKGPGVRTTAGHRVISTPNGTIATSSIDQHGPFGWLLGILLAKITNRYLALEGESLKQATQA
jgi:uncharacterized membrane protein